MADLNALVRDEPSLHEVDFDPAGFEWIDCHNWQDSILAFVRRGHRPEYFVVVVCNFTPVVRQGYRLGVPHEGPYQERFNSDSRYYDGSNVGNIGTLMATTTRHHGRPASLTLTLPPLAAVVLTPWRG